MNLYLIRHADAVPLGTGGVTEDEERPLSEIGHQQSRLLGQVFCQKAIALNRIVSSPLLRALQTAEGIVQGWTGQAPELVMCAELAPGGKRRKLARFLRQLNGEAVGLVGHEPSMGELAAWLIGSKRAQIDFAKAGVAMIACDEMGPRKGGGTLNWLVTPAWMIPAAHD
jgi:phosphohistidine phosphatase